MVLHQESGFNLDRLLYSALSNFTTTAFSVPVGNMKDIIPLVFFLDDYDSIFLVFISL